MQSFDDITIPVNGTVSRDSLLPLEKRKGDFLPVLTGLKFAVKLRKMGGSSLPLTFDNRGKAKSRLDLISLTYKAKRMEKALDQ